MSMRNTVREYAVNNNGQKTLSANLIRVFCYTRNTETLSPSNIVFNTFTRSSVLNNFGLSQTESNFYNDLSNEIGNSNTLTSFKLGVKQHH